MSTRSGVLVAAAISTIAIVVAELGDSTLGLVDLFAMNATISVVAATVVHKDGVYDDRRRMRTRTGSFLMAAVVVSLMLVALTAATTLGPPLGREEERLAVLLSTNVVVCLSVPFAWDWVSGLGSGRSAVIALAGLHVGGVAWLTWTRLPGGDLMLSAAEIALALVVLVLQVATGRGTPTPRPDRPLDLHGLMLELAVSTALSTVLLLGTILELVVRL
jgi:hypothetical protein